MSGAQHERYSHGDHDPRAGDHVVSYTPSCLILGTTIRLSALEDLPKRVGRSQHEPSHLLVAVASTAIDADRKGSRCNGRRPLGLVGGGCGPAGGCRSRHFRVGRRSRNLAARDLHPSRRPRPPRRVAEHPADQRPGVRRPDVSSFFVEHASDQAVQPPIENGRR